MTTVVEVHTDTRLCTVAGCTRRKRDRGLCHRHGLQQKAGQPFTTLPQHAAGDEPIAERMAWRTERTDTCWNWTGAVHSGGYGQIKYDGKVRYAHRVAWELAHGPVPDGLVIDHICRNRLCVNVEHLQVVTQKQNTENIGVPKNNTSGVRGVTWDKRHGKWHGSVMHNFVGYSAGYHDTIEDAERAVVAVRNRLHTNNLDDRA